jgi:hypothetical protein
MPQSTNLNKSPYFDDFNSNKNYYKVLFKPGNTVQARELTTLQSILQNQIETFGSGLYSDGGQVVPGGFSYDPSFNCVEIETYYKGINVEDYFNNLIGKQIKGKNTGIIAKVVKVLSNSESERETTTLYITYLSSSNNLNTESFTNNTFDNGEELITLEDFPVGSSFIFTNSEFARVLSVEGKSSTSIASAAKIKSGIYFIRGYFINVQDDILVLDQYSNKPSYRVGFEITEEIIDSNEDSSLNDNAQGFSNFAAPGSDRLKISTTLIKKSLEDFNDENFIEIFRIESGNIKFIKTTDLLSTLSDILAERTFDESGNYYVNPFSVELVESLNNNLGNKGYFKSGEKSPDGSIVSNDLALLKISPGKAYVKGYEVSAGDVLVDYPKPRTTSSAKSSSITFVGGDLLRVNNIKNVPNVGLTTTFSVSLMNKRLVGQTVSGISTIGFARVYDIESHNTSYENPSSQFNLYLFDIQTYTVLNLSSTIASLIVGSYVKGLSSGSYGYVKSINSTEITLYQVSGKFLPGEQISVDEIDYSTTISSVSDYSIDDVKSIFNNSTGFVCDTLLSKEFSISGPFNLITGTGVGTITSSDGSSFASSLKVNDIIKYSRSGINSSIYVGVTSIFNTKNKVIFESNSTVPNVCSNNIGVSTSYTIESISIIRPQIVPTIEGSTLYSKLNHENVSEVKTNNSNIYIKVKYNSVVKSGTTLTLQTLTGDYTYASFDEERYIVVNANGTVENLTTATFTRSNGNRNAEFTNLSATSGPCTVICTQIKSDVNPKFKKWNRCQSVEISKTKYSTPTNAGLAYTSVFGTRVEDSEISLNYPDIIEVHGIFESSTISSPSLPWITLTGLNSPNSNTSDLILGELVVGQTSGASAIYVEQKTNSQINLVYKSNVSFIKDEIIKFQESGYECTVSSVNIGDKNIINDYLIDNGQRKQYYDFVRILIKNNSKIPSARLKIYFDYFNFDSTDYGDVISANSYPKVLYGSKIPTYDGVRNTDIIDVRPRVANYNSSTKISPFEFSSRNFAGTGSNALQVISSNEDVIFDYDFYLPRVDKLTLDKDGNFNLILGEPKEFPITPSVSDEVLDVATIIGSPYVYDYSTDVDILLTDNRRFTMKDIRNLENRISNLEYYTSLSLLEIETKDLLIEDENGLNRFKSGFFVNDFSTTNSSDIQNESYRASIFNGTLIPLQNIERVDLTLYNDDSQKSISEINLSNTDCRNLRVTGSSLSINYDEISYISQNFSSRVTNVNPFCVVSWSGRLQLNPASDTWTITTRTQPSSRVRFIRSRNIEFISTRLRPNTRFNLLFDSYNMSSSPSYAFPKLIEIENVRGSFEIGETILVDGGKARFRLCVPNHKSGPHNSPTYTYKTNPYNPEVGISTIYGPQSTILNVDTSSLNLSNISNFYGNIRVGNTLTGQTSKAQATVKDVRLISDDNGTLVGSIFVPETSELRFSTGSTPVILTQSSTTGAFGEIVSSSNATFTSSGQIINISPPAQVDPIAQSFVVEDPGGIVPSSIEIYFSSKDQNLPVTVQIRELINGTPGGTNTLVGTLEKTLLPSEVNISNNGLIATRFTFDNLTRLEGSKEYAIVVLSDSCDYNVWISRIGEEEISTINNPEIEKIIINKQPSLGSLFISQNSSTWTPVQTDDLKFKLNRCQFSTVGGTAKFYNSKVEQFSSENKLPENPLFIGIGTTAPNDGSYILVNHPNHNMHSGSDRVFISGVISDVNPEKLSIGYGVTESGAISVASTTTFERFEGNPVAESNPGYIIVNNEIIRYTGVSAGTLVGITRGFDDTNIVSHSQNSLVYKYEFDNVSLRRINTEHVVSNIEPPTIDSYYVQVAAGTTFTYPKFGGGSNVYATRNKNFSELEVNENFIKIYPNADATASVRTISGTSVGGSEISFDDQGYSSIDLNGKNEFNTVRLIASKTNETQYLNSTEFIGSKSLTLDVNLNTSDDKLSPIIDLNQTFLTCNSYRINQPINLDEYATNNLVNSNLDDPHSFVYLTTRIDLQESANSLRVIFDSYRPAGSEFRVLYKIFRNDSPDENQVWELFPGYDNLDVNLTVKNESNNSGRSDFNVPTSRVDQYLEYEYTVNNLPDFTGFAIKIVGSTSNQALVPSIVKLRGIALK